MAFIREYAAAGDPFSLRIPKKLRRLKVGRFLGNVGRAALNFVPGGQVLSPLIGRVAQKYGLDEQTVLDFARSYGLDVGDPAPRPQNKRKTAGSGPKAKAAKKATRRAEKRGQVSSPTGSGNRGTGGHFETHIGLPPVDVGGIIRDLGGAVGIPGAANAGRGMRGLGLGGHRRSMNFANVRALRRGLRRLEGFEKLVKRVEKAFPRMRRAHAHPAQFHARGRKK